MIDVIPGSGENYIYYIGAFKKFAPNIIFIDKKNHELNAHQLTFTCAAFMSALLQRRIPILVNIPIPFQFNLLRIVKNLPRIMCDQ